MFGRSWLDTFGPVVVITIPIAWRVSFPSKVRMLWSTSCTTQWQNDPLIILFNQSEAFSFSIIDCLCHVTSLELKLYPSFDKSTTCHRDQNTWSFYTANLNSIDGKVDRGRIACVIHCLMLACWSEEEAHTSMNSFRFRSQLIYVFLNIRYIIIIRVASTVESLISYFKNYQFRSGFNYPLNFIT